MRSYQELPYHLNLKFYLLQLQINPYGMTSQIKVLVEISNICIIKAGVQMQLSRYKIESYPPTLRTSQRQRQRLKT